MARTPDHITPPTLPDASDAPNPDDGIYPHSSDALVRQRQREEELTVAHRQHRPWRHRSMLMHWMGRYLRRARKAAVAPLPAVAPGQVGISFAGHSSVLIRYADLRIVCDPMLGRWVKGVKRAVEPGLSPADLHDVDLILISHAHIDHLHRPTLRKLPRSATIVVPPRTAHQVSDLGFARVVELEVGQTIQDRGVDIITTPVRHGDEHDLRALSYVIRGQGPSVFFCGDSGYFSGFAQIGDRLRPDIALLPIGGYIPLSFRNRHMSPLDALYALEDLGARVMIPIHYGAFALSYEHLEEPQRWLDALVRERHLQPFVITLAPGESRLFAPPRSQRQRDATERESGLAGVGGGDDDITDPWSQGRKGHVSGRGGLNGLSRPSWPAWEDAGQTVGPMVGSTAGPTGDSQKHDRRSLPELPARTYRRDLALAQAALPRVLADAAFAAEGQLEAEVDDGGTAVLELTPSMQIQSTSRRLTTAIEAALAEVERAEEGEGNHGLHRGSGDSDDDGASLPPPLQLRNQDGWTAMMADAISDAISHEITQHVPHDVFHDDEPLAEQGAEHVAVARESDGVDPHGVPTFELDIDDSDGGIAVVVEVDAMEDAANGAASGGGQGAASTATKDVATMGPGRERAPVPGEFALS